MTIHAQAEKANSYGRQDHPQVKPRATGHGRIGEPGQCGGVQWKEYRASVPFIAIEAQDEAQQVDTQRHNPQERYGCDALADVVRRREKQG